MKIQLDEINQRCFVVAEISANHNHSLERAVQIVRAAADAGADAVKFQTYTADTITIDCDLPSFHINDTQWAGRTLYDLYKDAYTPWEWHEPIQRLANELGLVFFSTPFDASSVEYLEVLNVPLYKIASFEAVDLPLLRKVASTGKPVILSTGMASLGEIDDAVRTLRENGAGDITLLKCTSAYPAAPEDANLRTIPELGKVFSCPVGLSDHTLGSTVAIAAVSLGAVMVEKHFTLSRKDKGVDASFSMEPDEFRDMVAAIRTVERALGQICFESTAEEEASRHFRRSLFVVADVRRGDVFSEENVRSIRPGMGLPPKHFTEVIGRRAARDMARGTPLSWDLVL